MSVARVGEWPGAVCGLGALEGLRGAALGRGCGSDAVPSRAAAMARGDLARPASALDVTHTTCSFRSPVCSYKERLNEACSSTGRAAWAHADSQGALQPSWDTCHPQEIGGVADTGDPQGRGSRLEQRARPTWAPPLQAQPPPGLPDAWTCPP